MSATGFPHNPLVHPVRALQRALIEWWNLLQLGAAILVLAFSPPSYSPAHRTLLAQQIYLNTAPILLGFSVVCALVTVVLTRIVLVTALSYGLSQYALQLIIRVLVLELIPLTAALFVALRCTIPDGAELTALHTHGEVDQKASQSLEFMQAEVLPRTVAGLFSGLTLAGLSSVVVLVVAYLASYGFGLSGLTAYIRLFGQVFSPAVSLIFALKTLLFCLTVALIPMASAVFSMRNLPTAQASNVRTSAEMRGLVRMFALILLIEVGSLVGNYY